MISGRHVFAFSWTAPASPGPHILWAAGNAVDAGGTARGDGWALSPPLSIAVDCTQELLHVRTPPPIGSITRVDDAGAKTLVSEDLEDPVWITTDQNTSVAYVGLFHAGEIVSVELESGATTTIAHGLSCPEGVALDGVGNLW